LLNVRYRVSGLVIDSDEVFRALRKLLLKGYRVYVDSGYLYVDTGWGLLRAPLEDKDVRNWLMLVLAEDIEEYYGCLDVEGSIVLDVGAFMGETPCFFARKGAKKVYAFEPVKKFYDILIDNISLNGLDARISAYNYGVWFSDGEITINMSGGGSGLSSKLDEADGECVERVKIRSLADVIKFVSAASGEGSKIVAKFDCEGCEYALVNVDCDVIRKVREYVIEIHGAYLPILYKMRECGYRAKLVKELKPARGSPPLTIWHFKLAS